MIQGLEKITRLDRPKDVYYLKEIVRGCQPRIEKKTISSATSLGLKDSICWDDNFLYICISPNTWRRTALNSW